MRSDDRLPSPPVGLEELLGGIARGLVSAQSELDRAAGEVTESEATLPQGNVHLRPLWFVFARTAVDLELSTFAGKGAELWCRPLDPVAVALRDTVQSTGARVHIEIAPLGSALLHRE